MSIRLGAIFSFKYLFTLINILSHITLSTYKPFSILLSNVDNNLFTFHGHTKIIY